MIEMELMADDESVRFARLRPVVMLPGRTLRIPSCESIRPLLARWPECPRGLILFPVWGQAYTS